MIVSPFVSLYLSEAPSAGRLPLLGRTGVAIAFFEKLGGRRYGEAPAATPCLFWLNLESDDAYPPFEFEIPFSAMSRAYGRPPP